MALKPFSPLKYSYHLSYPKLTVIITSGTPEHPNAMAVSWHTYLSFNPPLYGVSISPKRYTCELIRQHGDFGVNFLPFELSEKVWLVGSYSGKQFNKIQKFDLEIMKASKINAPILQQSLVALECKVIKEVKTGDHIFFIGEIVYAWVQENILLNAQSGLLDTVKAKQVYYLGEGKFLTTDNSTVVEYE